MSERGTSAPPVDGERAPSRVVHHGDALAWLRERDTLEGASVVTSLPDVSELGALSHDEWERWFSDAVELVVSRVPPNGLAIFFQTDVKLEGRWIDKAALVGRGAERAGAALLFHGIVLRVPPGVVPKTSVRAGYSHLVAWSRGVKLEAGVATPDVIGSAGRATWTRGMGVNACRAACEAIVRLTDTRVIVDPFCGHGTVLAVANAMGLDAIGVELGGRRARRARALRLHDLERPQ
jgi:hypothetical protein